MTPRRWPIILAVLLLAAPAWAAEPTFPPGSRIGLVPPEGMTPSARFQGFEDREKAAAIITVTMPPDAYPEVKKTMAPDALKKTNITEESRENVTLPHGDGLLIAARQTQQDGTVLHKWFLLTRSDDVTALVTVHVPDPARDAYPDDTVRKTLASIAFRDSVPVDEQLSLLPFTLETRADFRVGAVLAGRGIILTDMPETAKPDTARIAPHMIIAIAPGDPANWRDRENFARTMFSTIPNYKDIRITTSEPLRINGQLGHQILAEATEARTETEVVLVHWIRFGTSGFMQILAVSPKAEWKDAYPRFRAVRDGVRAR
jgi:hypothetical protein